MKSIKGIEVLNSKKVITKEKFNWKWFFIMCSLMIVISFALVQFYIFIEVDTNMFDITSISLLFFGGIWGIISGVFMGELNAIPIKYAMEHKIAILDDSVTDRVKEEYKIIEQDGKLWTIREDK